MLRIPGFELVGEIGAGGFGAVYRARHKVLGREVAIKVLHERYAGDLEVAGRFVAEARAVAKLAHPQIVEIFEFGELAGGRPFFVMELLRGATLRDLLRERQRLALDEALPILRQIADALDAAHAAGVIHRDLKPDNVFVLDGGAVKLIDFGLAKLRGDAEAPVTETGAVFGTPLYMSPEQCRGKAVTPATDAYSFGALAYHVLVGEPPFAGEALELALHHLHDPPPRPSTRAPLPGAVDDVVLALMAKEPAARPTPLRRAIDAVTGAERVARRMRRGRATVAIAALVATAAGAGAFWGWHGGADEDRGRALAFTTRPIGIRLAQTRLADLRMSSDGGSVLYTTDAGRWRRDLRTGETRRVWDGPETLQPLSGGRMLRSVDLNEPGSPAIVDAAGRMIRQLPTMQRVAMSPDERMVAGLLDDWIVVHEIASGRTRRLASVAGRGVMGPVMWSPDSRTILSFSWQQPGRRVYATRVDDGATRPIQVPLLADATVEAAGSFLDDGRFIYCAEDATGISIRVRVLDDAAGITEQVVATLEPSASACGFTRAPGDHFVVGVTHARTQVATLDLRAARRELRIVPGDGSARVVTELSRDGRLIHAYTRGAGHLALGIYRRVPPGPPALREIAVLGGLERELPVCREEVSMVALGDALLHVTVARGASGVELVLRDDRCAPRHRWTLPAGRWSAPRCGRRSCVIVRRDHEDVEIWRLEVASHTARELARYRDDSQLGFNPTLGLAPDENNVVVLAGQGGVPRVIAMDGAIRSLGADMKIAQSVGWSRDPDAFLVTGMYLGDRLAEVVSVRLDGHMEPLWSSDTTWFGWVVGSPESDVIAGDARPFQIELVQLDRVDVR